MRAAGKPLSALLVGLGTGAVAGAYPDSPGMWYGVAVALAGIGLSFAGWRQPKIGADPTVGPASERPTLAGLGTKLDDDGR